MVNGRTNHGIQYLTPKLNHWPGGYCAPGSGAGLAFRHHARRQSPPFSPIRVGVLGLGVGAMAAYAAPGDVFRFYEINRLAVDYAAGTNAFFTYMRDCRGRTQVVLGDGRLSLERELVESGSEQYDILLLDAFSSDAVPVHLLTMEAMDIYLRHLRDDDSILAVNITNRYIDLRPIVAALAAHAGMKALWVFYEGDPPLHISSNWVLLTRSRAFLSQPDVQKAGTMLNLATAVPWTDSLSNIFRQLRR